MGAERSIYSFQSADAEVKISGKTLAIDKNLSHLAVMEEERACFGVLGEGMT